MLDSQLFLIRKSLGKSNCRDIIYRTQKKSMLDDGKILEVIVYKEFESFIYSQTTLQIMQRTYDLKIQ